MHSATKAALSYVVGANLGTNSWCKLNKHKKNGTGTHKHDPGIPPAVVVKLKPIFVELSHEKLLKRCIHGLNFLMPLFRTIYQNLGMSPFES